MLDLSVLKDRAGKVCVRCRDEESALNFLREIKAQYPKVCGNWKGTENHWKSYGLTHMDYFPYIKEMRTNSLCWDGDDYAEMYGYEIIEYYDLPGAKELEDLGEFMESEFSIDSLFE